LRHRVWAVVTTRSWENWTAWRIRRQRRLREKIRMWMWQSTSAPHKYCQLASVCHTDWLTHVAWIFTGSIARSCAQAWRYLIYSEADLEVFRPAGATRCTDAWGEIWHGEGDLHAKFHPHRCSDKGVGPPKLKFLLRFDRNVEYERSAGAYSLRDFHKIYRVYTSFQDALGVKIWLDLLNGLWSYGSFTLRGSGFPQIFSARYRRNYASDPQTF